MSRSGAVPNHHVPAVRAAQLLQQQLPAGERLQVKVLRDSVQRELFWLVTLPRWRKKVITGLVRKIGWVVTHMCLGWSWQQRIRGASSEGRWQAAGIQTIVWPQAY